VYDFKNAANLSGTTFAFRNEDDVKEEYRWFAVPSLKNLDGSEEWDSQGGTQKYYMTNFVQALPDTTNANAFYLAQRGRGGELSPYSNNVLKITQNDGTNPLDPSQLTSSVYQIERVYGFMSTDQNLTQRDDNQYLSAMTQITFADTTPYMLLNHYRDVSLFRNNEYFSIVAAATDYTTSHYQKSILSTKTERSFFQLAAILSTTEAQTALVATCSFFTDTVRIMRFHKDDGFSEIHTIQ
jgi:hypothetical protein